MNRKLSLIAMVSAILAGPIWAAGPIQTTTADVIVVPPPPSDPVSEYDWTGFSTGIQLAYGDAETSGAVSLEGDGPLVGLRAYYDYDFGDFVLGGGLQFDGADIDLGGGTTIESVIRLAARVGVDLNRNWAEKWQPPAADGF